MQNNQINQNEDPASQPASQSIGHSATSQRFKVSIEGKM